MKIWKTIPQFPDYQASSGGQIRRKRDYLNPSRRGRTLSQRPGRKGYLIVCIADKTKAVAPLICSAFKGLKPTPRHQAAHRNGVNTDNRSKNISWLTPEENYQDSIRHGTHKKGERCHAAKLKDAQVLKIRTALLTKRQCEVRKIYNLSESQISRIALRRTWSHI